MCGSAAALWAADDSTDDEAEALNELRRLRAEAKEADLRRSAQPCGTTF